MEKQITVTIELNGWLEKYFQGSNTKSIQLPENSVVKDIIEKCSLPDNMIGIIAINGVNASRDQQIQEQDCISFYPMVEGG